jgi:protein-arginine kinase activator protein McsA
MAEEKSIEESMDQVVEQPPEREREKPLDKYTVKELKEMALAFGTIQGVSAMKKQELIDAIKAEKGIPIKKKRDTPAVNVINIKQEIRSLKEDLSALREQKQKAQAARLRKKISRLKKKTRRLAQQMT